MHYFPGWEQTEAARALGIEALRHGLEIDFGLKRVEAGRKVHEVICVLFTAA